MYSIAFAARIPKVTGSANCSATASACRASTSRCPFDPASEDPEVVESAPPVAVIPTEDHYFDSNRLAHRAATVIPWAATEEFPIKLLSQRQGSVRRPGLPASSRRR